MARRAKAGQGLLLFALGYITAARANRNRRGGEELAALGFSPLGLRRRFGAPGRLEDELAQILEARRLGARKLGQPGDIRQKRWHAALRPYEPLADNPPMVSPPAPFTVAPILPAVAFHFSSDRSCGLSHRTVKVLHTPRAARRGLWLVFGALQKQWDRQAYPLARLRNNAW